MAKLMRGMGGMGGMGGGRCMLPPAGANAQILERLLYSWVIKNQFSMAAISP